MYHYLPSGLWSCFSKYLQSLCFRKWRYILDKVNWNVRHKLWSSWLECKFFYLRKLDRLYELQLQLFEHDNLLRFCLCIRLYLRFKHERPPVYHELSNRLWTFWKPVNLHCLCKQLGEKHFYLCQRDLSNRLRSESHSPRLRSSGRPDLLSSLLLQLWHSKLHCWHLFI